MNDPMGAGAEAGSGGPDGQQVDWDAALPDYVGPAPSGPSRGVVAGVVTGVIALLAAGLFAVAVLSGSDGADTPEAAVERLFDALADEDVIGLLEALAPGERRAVLDPVRDVTSELQRLGVLADEFDLGGVEGFDFRVEGLELTSAALGPGVAEVRVVAGTLHAEIRPADIPFGPVLQDLLEQFEADLEPTSDTTDLTDDPEAVIVAIEEGGGWHVSLGYSIAEQWRRDAGEPVPAFGEGIEARGAADSEGAVRAMLEAALDLDLRGVIALTPPDEMRALHDYAPLFLDDIEAEAAELRHTTDLQLDRLETEVVERRGASARVAITGLAVSGTIDGEDGYVNWDGECMEWRDQYGEDRQCLHDLEDEGLPESLTDTLGTMFRLTTVERDGEWFVSPVRTGLDGVVDVLRLVEREDVETFAEFVASFPLFLMGTSERFESEGWEMVPEEFRPPGADCFDEHRRAFMESEEILAEEEVERLQLELQACLDAHGMGDGSWSTYGNEERLPGEG